MLGYFVGSIQFRAGARSLDEGVDAPFDELAVARDTGHQHRSITRDARHVYSEGRTEIAEAISNQVTLVTLESAGDVRAVAKDQIGSQVDAVVREDAQIAAVLTQIGFRAVGPF